MRQEIPVDAVNDIKPGDIVVVKTSNDYGLHRFEHYEQLPYMLFTHVTTLFDRREHKIGDKTHFSGDYVLLTPQRFIAYCNRYKQLMGDA